MVMNTSENFLLALSKHARAYLFSWFTPPSIITLTKTSRVVKNITNGTTKVDWNILHLLNAWFKEPRQFLHLLHECEALISGSQVVQFFEREKFIGSDMDIYTSIGSVTKMASWLHAEGYIYTGSYGTYHSEPYAHSIDRLSQPGAKGSISVEKSILAVYNFAKDGLQLQIIAVSVHPVEHILFEFHSTAVMNFITCHGAISLFPQFTFKERRSFVTDIKGNSEIGQEKWKSKYEARGYQVIGPEADQEPNRGLYRKRYVNDSRCWTINFNCEYCNRGTPSLTYSAPFEVLPAVSGHGYIRIQKSEGTDEFNEGISLDS